MADALPPMDMPPLSSPDMCLTAAPPAESTGEQCVQPQLSRPGSDGCSSFNPVTRPPSTLISAPPEPILSPRPPSDPLLDPADASTPPPLLPSDKTSSRAKTSLPGSDGQAQWRWRATKWQLTYRGHIPKQTLIDKVHAVTKVPVVAYSIVHRHPQARVPCFTFAPLRLAHPWLCASHLKR
eukprot:1679207-Pleurochrysis_carterae.AAC.1